MIVSTKGKYAVRVMVELALQDSNVYIPLRKIAESQDISLKYLEAIVHMLMKNNFIEGTRGRSGGYRLNRAPEGYTLWDILECTEESLDPVSCVGDHNACTKSSQCYSFPIWKGLQAITKAYFESFTLADIVQQTYTDVGLETWLQTMKPTNGYIAISHKEK